jgi:hypothetical protein
MLQDWLKLPPGERKPVHLKDNISMVVYDSSSGLLFVAYTLENMQPLQIIEALKAITTCLHSAFGGLSEEKACSFLVHCSDPVPQHCGLELSSRK